MAWKKNSCESAAHTHTHTRTGVSTLPDAAREEELARMLSGAEITAEARAAARALVSASQD
jgi:DNA repair protein RecN (Recombination protein N)